MTEVTRLDIHHPEVVEGFAAAWASIDGKIDAFLSEKGRSYLEEGNTGTYEGYMTEESELLNRAGRWITSFDLFERLDPSTKP